MQNRPESRLWYWSISIGFAAILLYWSVRGIQWSKVWHSLASARLPYILMCCFLITTNLFLRAVRWRILLSAEGRVPVPVAFWSTSAGYFGNNFLPARSGELVRTMMVSARTGLSRTYVLTTALSERMVDAITLVVISACVLLVLPSKPGWLAEAAKPFAVIGFGGILAIGILPRLDPLLEWIIGRIPVPHGVRRKLVHVLDQALLGIRSFHDVRRLFGFVALTIAIWFFDAVIAVAGARALGLSFTVPIAFLLIAALGLGSALPSTPGYIGVYQFVAVTVLMPFGFSRDESIAYVLLFQALLYIVITFWGLLAFWQLGRPSAGLVQSAAASTGPL